MGLGDQLMATGMARGARDRGRRKAFGDGRKILWDPHSAEVFRNNPNIAPPGSERDRDLEWVAYYKGHRVYNRQAGDRWIWNPDFHPIPGEVFFSGGERRAGARYGSGFVVVEPEAPAWKSCAPNKNWGRARYEAVAGRLRAAGVRVVQFRHPRGAAPLAGVESLATTSFRDALSVLRQAGAYLGVEGGLHHGAAALGRPAVVLFGGFIPPEVTGYPDHVNLTGGAEACGSLRACRHCEAAMAAIEVEEVFAAVVEKL